MPAGQAYYDSIARLYASWGVDLIKVDCIAFGPYKGDEIRMLSRALAKTGPPHRAEPFAWAGAAGEAVGDAEIRHAMAHLERHLGSSGTAQCFIRRVSMINLSKSRHGPAILE